MAAARALPAPASRWIATTTLCIAAFTAIGARVAVSAMHAQHTYADYFPISFNTWDRIGTNVRVFAQSFAQLVNGDFSGAPIHGRGLLDFACAAAGAAAVAVTFRCSRDWFRSVTRQPTTHASADPVRSAHVGFWVTAVAATVLAFVFSDVTPNSRYLLTVPYGIAAVVAVAASGRSRRRALAVLGAGVVVVGSLVALGARDIKPNSNFEDFAQKLAVFADGENLHYGYAAYWDAAAVTWMSHGAVQLFPVQSCDAPHGLCRYWFHVVSSWYTPRPTRTFLVIDPGYGPKPPGAALGGVAESVSIDGYTVDVYDYDIASNLGPPLYPPQT